MLDLDVGNGSGFFAGAQGVLAVVRDFEAWDARGADIETRIRRATASSENGGLVAAGLAQALGLRGGFSRLPSQSSSRA